MRAADVASAKSGGYPGVSAASVKASQKPLGRGSDVVDAVVLQMNATIVHGKFFHKASPKEMHVEHSSFNCTGIGYDHFILQSRGKTRKRINGRHPTKFSRTPSRTVCSCGPASVLKPTHFLLRTSGSWQITRIQAKLTAMLFRLRSELSSSVEF